MEYRNEKGFGIMLTELGRVLQPFERISLTEEQLQMPTIKGYIDQKILMPFTKIGDVVLPPGVSSTPEEFGHVLVDGVSGLPGTGTIKTLDEVMTEKSAALNKEMEQVGEDLKKKQ